MTILEIFLLAAALSMDAAAVALAAAATGRLAGPRAAARLAFHFGLFQFFMPVLGWAAGATLDRWISPVDHWVAFGLLAIVGARMLWPKGDAAEAKDGDPSRGWRLMALSTATSLDALAVGLSLAMLRVDVWQPSVIIGCVTMTLSLLAVRLGNRLAAAFGRRAEIAGGLILLGIAVRIVATHL
ncbi:MAG: manganese efflux pump MntP family protein [Planctomycetota bacterium]